MMVREDRIARQCARAFMNVYYHEVSFELVENAQRCAAFLSSIASEVWFIDLAAVEDDFKFSLIKKFLEKFNLITLMPLAELLIKKRMLHLFGSALNVLKKEYMLRNGIMEFAVSSAIELDEESKKTIKKFLEKKTGLIIKAQFSVDPSLIAGICCLSDQYRWEYSLRKRCAQLKMYTLDR